MLLYVEDTLFYHNIYTTIIHTYIHGLHIYGEQIIKVFYISSFIKCRLYGILMVYFDILIIRYIATTSYY